MNDRPQFAPIPCRVWVIDPVAQTLHHTRFNVNGIRDGAAIELRADQTLGGSVALKPGDRERYRFRQLRRDNRTIDEWAAFRIHGELPVEHPWWRLAIVDLIWLMIAGAGGYALLGGAWRDPAGMTMFLSGGLGMIWMVRGAEPLGELLVRIRHRRRGR